MTHSQSALNAPQNETEALDHLRFTYDFYGFPTVSSTVFSGIYLRFYGFYAFILLLDK